MNKIKFFAFFLTIGSFSFSQNNSTFVNSENGVKVYKSNGVEGNTHKQSETFENKQISISEYNIAQCENAIQGINDKINYLISNNDSEDRIILYRQKIQRLEERLNEIKLLNNK
jgi:hypothetical protein